MGLPDEIDQLFDPVASDGKSCLGSSKVIQKKDACGSALISEG